MGGIKWDRLGWAALFYPPTMALLAELGTDLDGPVPSGATALTWHMGQIAVGVTQVAWGVVLLPGEIVARGVGLGSSWARLPVIWAVAAGFWMAMSALVSGRSASGVSSGGGWAWFGWWGRVRDWFEKEGKGPTARWAGMLETLSCRWRRGDIFLGRPRGIPAWIGIQRAEKHMVTIAGPGAGKSTGALIPNLCLHEGSVLCIDPKGELAMITGRRRQRMGQKLVVLDPFGLSGLEKGAYNPFDEIARVADTKPELVESFAGQVSEALVKPMSQSDAYWDKAAKTLLTGLILYVAGHEPPERRSLIRVRELAAEGMPELRDALIAGGSEKTKKLTAFDVMIEALKEMRDGPYGRAIARAAASLDLMAEPQRGSVMTTLQEHTAFIDNPVMERALGSMKEPLTLDALRREKVSVYVCLPANAVTGREGRWFRMFVMLFIEIMMKEPMGAPNPPVLMAVDEFPNLGKIDGIELVAPMMRSYGVRFWAVGQDVSQFKDVYPNTWTGFIGGAEAVQFMGLNHPATLDLIVDLIGRHEVGGPQKREYGLMDRDQLARFLDRRKRNQIIWFGSRRPFRLKICPYYETLPKSWYDPDPRYT